MANWCSRLESFSFLQSSICWAERGVGEKRKEEGDERRFVRVVFDRVEPVFDLLQGLVGKSWENSREKVEFMELQEHGAQLSESVAFGKFLADPLDRNSGKEFLCMGPDRLLGVRVDLETETAGEAHAADHAEAVFFDPLVGVADSADDFFLQILPAADEIEDFLFEGIVEHAVDRKIAPLRVLRRRCEFDAGGPAAIFIIQVLPESSYLVLMPLDDDEHDPESDADGYCMGKEGLDRLWRGIGRNIDIVRRVIEEKIAHPAACIIGDEAGFR